MVYQKQDIEFHDDGSSSAWEGGTDYPAIDVKCYGSVFDEMKEAFPELTDKEVESIGNQAWEQHRELFWDYLAQEAADKVWGNNVPSFQNGNRSTAAKVEFVSAGRSDGWLVVTNLGDVETVSKYWNKKDVALWGKFEKAIDDLVTDLNSAKMLTETATALLE